jgi:hypothetical protein
MMSLDKVWSVLYTALSDLDDGSFDGITTMDATFQAEFQAAMDDDFNTLKL